MSLGSLRVGPNAARCGACRKDMGGSPYSPEGKGGYDGGLYSGEMAGMMNGERMQMDLGAIGGNGGQEEWGGSDGGGGEDDSNWDNRWGAR